MPTRLGDLSRIACAGCILSLAACGGDDGSPKDRIATTDSDTAFRSVAGIYDWSDTYDGQRDEFYLEVTEDGRWITHDYLGDAFDEGENCYAVFGTLELGHIGGDRFSIMHEGQPIEFTLRRQPGGLYFAYVDVLDDDDDGDVTETISEVIPPADGLSATDFNACEVNPYENNFDDGASGGLRTTLTDGKR